VGERAELRLENRSGTVVVRGEETRQARIEVVARIWAESDAEADDQLALIDKGIQHDGQRINVRAPALLRPTGLLFLFGRGPRIDYQIVVPHASEAWLASRSGRIEVARLTGPLNVEARSGRVAAADIASDTTIVSRSGSVETENIGGALSVESRSGGVKARRCAGNTTVISRSGTINLEDVRGTVRLDSRSGSITILGVGGGLHVRVQSGSIRYEGPVKDAFDIEAMSGSVLLAVDRDSVFLLDAEALSGTVTCDLPLRRSAPEGPSGAGGPQLRVRTHSGSIRIVPR
jgi:DUF4097 and DUF4098 domain-containing protein YvlB